MPMPSHPAVDVGSSVELLLLPREENILFCKKNLTKTEITRTKFRKVIKNL